QGDPPAERRRQDAGQRQVEHPCCVEHGGNPRGGVPRPRPQYEQTHQGAAPMTINITKARLIGPECKVMCDNLLSWMSPASGLLGAITSAIMTAIGLDASRPPDLIVQWGPPVAGFMVTAQMTKVDITYARVSSDGIPIHAVCNLTLKESPSPLSMTNPTSGGRPGRNPHLILHGR